jgi:hypothetical protein
LLHYFRRETGGRRVSRRAEAVNLLPKAEPGLKAAAHRGTI